jgi:hypothetical protein
MALKTIPVVRCASSVPSFDKYKSCVKDASSPIHQTSYLSEIN